MLTHEGLSFSVRVAYHHSWLTFSLPTMSLYNIHYYSPMEHWVRVIMTMASNIDLAHRSSGTATSFSQNHASRSLAT
jgi:hypothetical protein